MNEQQQQQQKVNEILQVLSNLCLAFGRILALVTSATKLGIREFRVPRKHFKSTDEVRLAGK